MVESLIFDPSVGRLMRVACFMSGSGTNTRKIIEHSLEGDSKYRVAVIFTDVKDERLYKSVEKRCRAKDIAEEYGIAYECVDIRDFYRCRGHKTRRDLSLRPEFDSMAREKVKPHDIDVVANAGYMSIMTEPLLDRYSGRIVNVHPADLSIMEGSERKYVGIHVVRDAILSGETELRASTHIVREKVDYGEILVVSEPVKVELPPGVSLDQLEARASGELLSKDGGHVPIPLDRHDAFGPRAEQRGGQSAEPRAQLDHREGVG